MEEAIRPAISLPATRGFAGSLSPVGLGGYWFDTLRLPDGQTGVLLGCCTAAGAEGAHAQIRAALQRTADPALSLAVAAEAPASVLRSKLRLKAASTRAAAAVTG